MLQLRHRVRLVFMSARIAWLNFIWGHRVHRTARISFSAFLDKSAPKLIVIGERSIVTKGAMVLSHDYSRGVKKETVIGKCCMVGANSIILPGVRVGDHSVIGAGSVVTCDVPPNSLVVGNPARVVRAIHTGPYGRILESSAS